MKRHFVAKALELQCSRHHKNRPVLIALVIFALYNNLSAMSVETNTSPTTTTIVQCKVITENCEDGTQFISKLCSVAQALNNYSSRYEMVVFKQQPPIVEAGMFAFRQPRLMRVEVDKGPKKGAVATLCADGKVHGHLGGALKFFRAAVSADSELVRAANNFPMVGTDFYSLAAYLKNMLKENDQSRVTNTPVQTNKTAAPAYVLDMYSTNNGKELLLKRIYISPQTYLPVYWEDYTDGKIWSESSWRDLKQDVEFPDNYFKP
jgi:outer membrane lipoprotein-sorting protein